MAKKSIQPEIIYLHGNALIPAKALSYKVDKNTRNIIEKIKPRTHTFENNLRKDLGKELIDIDMFPTKDEVLVSIVHGIHSQKEYNQCDLDNRAKTILDALKSVVYIDDSQVRMLWTHKVFLKDKQESFFRISIKLLNGKTTKEISEILNQII